MSSTGIFNANREVTAGCDDFRLNAISPVSDAAEYFPKKDRAYSTSIFNAGASIGALIAPLSIPLLAKAWG